jgi:hypothetical protein
MPRRTDRKRGPGLVADARDNQGKRLIDAIGPRSGIANGSGSGIPGAAP